MPTRIDIRTQASTGEWVRPAGWLALPDISTTDKTAVGIFAVYENEENACSIAIATSSSITYSIDWGDGTSASVSGTSIQTKRFDYASLSSVILQDEAGYNYKQSLVTISFVSGAATSIDLGPVITQGGSNNWLDTACNWSTGYLRFGTRRPNLMQRMQIFSANYTGINLNSYYQYFPSLRKVLLPSVVTGVGSSQQTFAYNGNMDPFDLDWSTSTTAYGFFQNSMMNAMGNIRIAISGSTANLFTSCQNLTTVGDIDVTNSTSLSQVFYYCTKLQQIGTITNVSNTTLQYAFGECGNLREIVFTSVANVTVTTGAFYNCFSLRKLRLPGMKVSFTITGCNMQRTELVDLFNDLSTGVTGQTITVTNNPGVADLTAADILIATAKGWTVTL
jgi:hypothetical protein